ncbi:MAG: hypothetical protein HRT58_21935 [Crocinitomicaceae bacterium]|nr:hypothetical protein [Flavobacteriales bacterium]NQZ38336.1 hypothetical protein [Crocinitomicaceae bacterium]
MPREEFYEELRIRETELIDELDAIRRLLNDVYKVGTMTFNKKKETMPTDTIDNTGVKIFKAKGDTAWSVYWFEIAQTLDGKFKAKDVSDIGTRSNPDMDQKTVRNSAKGWLSKLAGSGKLQSTRGVSLKEGNTYWN